MVVSSPPAPVLGGLLRLIISGLKIALRRVRLRWSFSKNEKGQVQTGVEVDLGADPQEHNNPYFYE